uniref:Uncharacterized protein AlNc14C66G4668 n=1 Tax=Albugo laibachii Nc14 TaxID=890382 RepID=F0WDE8_9STRA|nr:conserved hypothetical protein [Albugo laibachii Nc14]|eukprot:CCA19220.1 conserved hypothetical protein [Albugo laibachii Nc14]
MSIYIHSADAYNELCKVATEANLRPTLKPTMKASVRLPQPLPHTTKRNVEIRKKRHVLGEDLNLQVVQSILRHKQKREAKYQQLWRQAEEGKILADKVHDELATQERERHRQMQKMNSEWNCKVFYRLNDSIVRQVDALDASQLNKQRNEAYTKFLSVNDRKGGLFRDIIIESEYNPLQDIKYLMSSVQLDDPVKRILTRRQNEIAEAEDSDAMSLSSHFQWKKRDLHGLGRNDNLDVKLYAKGRLESTPYGYFQSEGGGRYSNSKTTESRVQFDHYNFERGEAIVSKEFPKGRRTNYEFIGRNE